MAQQISTNTFGVAKWVVSPTVYLGTHTSVNSAITSASSGDTVYVLPGTYTENITAKAGITVVAIPGNQNQAVIIVGKISSTITGTMTFNGIQFQTNNDYILVTSGANLGIINFYNCYWNCTNFTGANNACSNASSLVNFFGCSGDVGIAGGSFFTSATSTVSFYNTVITNSSGSTTPISFTSGTLVGQQLEYYGQIQISSSGQFKLTNSIIDSSALNVACISGIATSGSSLAMTTRFLSGTASAITIASGHTLTMIECAVSSSNTNALTGAGTITYSPVVFFGSSSGFNTTTQTPILTGPGGMKGLVTGTPGAGFMGEQIRSAIASGSAVTLTSATGANITSISLTAGIWDVTGVVMFKGVVTGTASGASIGTTSATTGTQGDNYVTTPTVSTALDLGVVVPPYRISLTSTTTVYLVGIAIFTVGTQTAYGRISATRVG
jgi:hypothetical protein